MQDGGREIGHDTHDRKDNKQRDYIADDRTPLLSSSGTPQSTPYKTLNAQDEERSACHQDDEERASLQNDSDRGASSRSIYATLSVLLVGVFVSQTDASLVLANYAKVASEFNELASGSWLISAFALAQCVAQPLYGKLSGIYGRKSCLQASYILFALGTLGSGLGTTMGQVIAARAVQGLGGAGMVSMVSIIITDIVPVHEVGSLRSYVNILQTTGRGCGGVIGGYLTETIGWRWAFLVQVPPTLIAIALVQWRFNVKPVAQSHTQESAWTKLKRIDFVGAVFLCLTVGAWCFVIDIAGGRQLTWDSPIIIASMVVGSVSAVAFAISGRYATDPIFPLRLWVQRAVITNYAIVTLQMIVQISLMASVPLFIQATHKISMAGVGAYLIPAFAGNTIGGLLAGYWVKRTRTHKPITYLGTLMGCLCMVLCLLIWQGTDHVSFAKSLVIFPGGFANGIVSSSAFVALTAGVEPGDVAIAGSGMYMFFNIGAIAGVSAGSAVYQMTLASGLQEALHGVKGHKEIIRRALADISYVQDADEGLRKLLVPSYVAAFHSVNYMGLACSIFSVLFTIISPGSSLRAPKTEREQGEEEVEEDDSNTPEQPVR